MVLQLPTNDVLLSQKEHFLEALGIGKQHFWRNGPIPQKLISIAQMLVATEEDLALLTNTNDVSVGFETVPDLILLLRAAYSIFVL